jgi:hypothetical protein
VPTRIGRQDTIVEKVELLSGDKIFPLVDLIMSSSDE